MGHSKLCNYYGELRSGTKGYTIGIDSIKQAKGWLESDNTVNPNMNKIDAVYLIPQTSRAKQIARGFYCLKVTSAGIQYLNITDSI